MAIRRATVSFTEEDLKRLDRLKEALELSSVSQTISALIRLTDELRGQVEEGREIVITDHHNFNKSLLIPGLSKH